MKMNLNKIHSACGWHKEAILKSKNCGCFYCLSIFPPNEIVEWITEPKDCPRGPGETAICPKCGIDSVLPDTIEYDLTKGLLAAMKQQFFN